MPKQTKKTKEVKEVKEVKTVSPLENFKAHHEIDFIPKPTRTFEVGESVSIGNGNLVNAVIQEVYEDGLCYLVSYEKYEEKLKKHVKSSGVFEWLKLSKGDFTEKKFFDGHRLRISYSQMHLQSLFVYVYGFGTDFEPSYQREYVWTDEDKESLIDSIFNHVDIGKFAFVELPFSKEYKHGYEVLDGKQRLRALCDFYEGRFAYKGVYYHQLQESDKAFFMNYNVNVAMFNDLTHEEKLLYFLKMNHSGKVMDAKHLEKIRKEYDAIQSEKVKE